MHSPNRRHDRQTFYKYMSASTACAVLTHRTLRWSSPVLFNDPFDVPRQLLFEVDPDEIFRALGRRMRRLIESPPEDTGSLSPNVRQIVDAVKSGISSELTSALLTRVTDFTSSHIPSGAATNELRNLWTSWLPDLRILCLTESPSHVAMWHHYADRYRGVVLEFKCIDELDSAWLTARPVTYPAEKPAVYSADGWAELLTLQTEVAIRKMFHVATYTKSPDWSYESEWRIASFKRPTDIGDFNDYRFSPEELSAIYFGPLIDPVDRQSVQKAASAFAAARLWDVRIGMSRQFSVDAADT